MEDVRKLVNVINFITDRMYVFLFWGCSTPSRSADGHVLDDVFMHSVRFIEVLVTCAFNKDGISFLFYEVRRKNDETM